MQQEQPVKYNPVIEFFRALYELFFEMNGRWH